MARADDLAGPQDTTGPDSLRAPVPDPAPAPPSHLLTSWKEIAVFFDRHVRTVQRWEREEGLPVRRRLHKKQSTVYADPDELASWWYEHETGASVEEPGPVQPKTTPARTHEASHTATAARPARALVGVTAVLGIALATGTTAHFVRRGDEGGDGAARPDGPLVAITAYTGEPGAGPLSAVFVGDFDGDGNDDLALGAPSSGDVYLLLHNAEPAGGTAVAEVVDVANARLHGEEPSEWALVDVADFNGDGVDDLHIVESRQDSQPMRTGWGYLVFGRGRWPERLQLPEDADVALQFDYAPDARLGGCNGRRGRLDLDGDGIDDVVVTASEFSNGEARSSGAAFVVRGRRRWPARVDVPSAATAAVLGGRMGQGLAGPCQVGDFDGDGRPDLAIHADEDTLWLMLGARGRTYVLLGREQWGTRLDADADADFAVLGDRPRAISTPVLLADIDGDGIDDLVLGRPGYEEEPSAPGSVEVWLGGRRWRGRAKADAADVVIEGLAPGGRFGVALGTDDLDGDGIQDLLVASAGEGILYLLYGRRDWRARGTLEEVGAVALFSAPSLASVFRIDQGDLDGDGLSELVLASPAPLADTPESAGRAWVVSPYHRVRVDLRPGREPNVVVPEGISAVRLYGAWPAAAMQIDGRAIHLAGASPIRVLIEDFDHDGIDDVQAYFDNESLHLPESTSRIAVTARTRSGRLVGGIDEALLGADGSR